MPSFREAELGPEQAKKLPFGSYYDRVAKAVPKMSEDLEHLHKLALPVNKSFTPVKHGEGSSDPAGEIYEKIPEKAKKFLEYCRMADMVTSEDKAAATTESVVVWCGHLKRSADMKYELSEHEYHTNKRRKTHEDELEKKRMLEQAFLEKHCKEAFAPSEEVRQQHAQMLVERGPEHSS